MVCPLFQLYVYVDVPPLGFTVALPLLPLHAAGVEVAVAVNAVGWVMVTVAVVVAATASATIIE